MPSFSRNLEQTLHRALAAASERRHEYATLEHLLLSLLDDAEAAAVMRACSVDIEALRKSLVGYIEHELDNLVTELHEDPKPTSGFQRVIQRAVIHVQSSGREEVTGANVLVAIFAERESHAAYFLQEQEMTRYDAVNYISHGIAKRPGHSDTDQGPARRRGGARPRRIRARRQGARFQEEGNRARSLLRQPEQQGERGPDRSADRPRGRSAAHHPGSVPPSQEQSAAGRRPRRRQDRDRGRSRAQDRARRNAGSAQGRDGLCPRHGRAAGRHPLSRRFRGAPQAGDEGNRAAQEGDPVHRRDPYGDRRGGDLRRLDGRLQPAQARARAGGPALHRLDHLQGIPPIFREGPRPGPALPEDRRQRAVDPGHDRNPEGPEALFRGVPQAALHQ